MWKCKICDTLNRDENCTVCGAHWTTGETVSDQEPQQSATVYPEQPYTYQENGYGMHTQTETREQKNNGLVITIVICVTIIVAMLLGIGAYIFVQKDDVVYPESVVVVTEEPAATSVPVATPVPTTAATPVPTPVSTPTPTPTPVPTKNPAEALAQKNAFLSRADSIAAVEQAEEGDGSQQEMNQAAYRAYEMWDGLLNDVYQYLKNTLPAGEFERLKKEEVQWIKTKESAMDAAEAEFEGGSAAPLMRYSTGAAYTRERCYELIDMIK